jgi:hypothetical protein
MIVNKKELDHIDKEMYQEDLQKFSITRGLVREILLARRTTTSCIEDFDMVPLFWCPFVQASLLEMIKEFNNIAFIAVKNINYGVRIHHTSTVFNLNNLNKIKLGLAQQVDIAIIDRVTRFYNKKG